MNMKLETMAERIIKNVNKEYCNDCSKGQNCESCEDPRCQLGYEIRDLIKTINEDQISRWKIEGTLSFLEGYTRHDSRFFLKKVV